MASEWREVPIKGLSLGIYDGPHATPKKTDSGPIFLGISNLESGRLNLSDVEHLSEDDFKQWTRRITPQKDDLVFSYETRLGEAALIPEGLKCCLGRRMALIRFDLNKADPKFMLYAYLGPQFQSVLKTRTIHGSTVDRIPLVDFPNFPIVIPPLPIQRQIAAILSAFDDKIELNRQMNRTLEQMARALFKSWFVDFDPVRAKLRGEQPEGMDAETAALFPDELVEVDGREVPKGWEWGTFDADLIIFGGGTPKTTNPDFWGGEIPWYSVVDAPSEGNIWVSRTEKTITAEGLNGSSTRLLPVGTTIISARGTVGKLALTAVPLAMNQSCYGLYPQDGSSINFTYFSALNAVEALKRRTHGAVFDTITRDTLHSISEIKPTSNVLLAFERECRQITNLIRSNIYESAHLAQLRDSLLPRLLSGKVDVSEWEADY